jgi:hypothetical protein
MALSGKIADWSLADILQMVSTERKSGVITLELEDEEVRFDFFHGNVVNAHDHRRRRRVGRVTQVGEPPETALSGFAAFLNVTGRIRPADGPLLMRTAVDLGGDQLEAARRTGILKPEELEEAITEYAQELLHRVLTWQVGDYHFVSRTPQDPKPAFYLNTEGLLLEGMRRIDETPRIQEVVGHETIFRRTAGVEPPADLSSRETQMLARIDGQSSAAKLARASHLGDHDAAKSLYRLVEHGLIEPVPEPLREEPAQEEPVLELSLEELEPVPRGRRLLRLASLVVLCAVSVAFREITSRSASEATARHDPRLAQGVALARAVYRQAYDREAEHARDLKRVGLLSSGYWGKAAESFFASDKAEDAADR